MNGILTRPGVIDRHFNGHRGDGRCNCGCGNFNAYRFPRPIGKVQRLLDTTKLEIHTDEFVGETCFQRDPCCAPIPVKVEEKVKSFIIHAATDCLEPVTYYTLHINHPLPLGIFAEPTFIRVEKCGLFQDPVKLIYTKSTFPMCEFDGNPKCGCPPSDPAFPNDGVEVVFEGDAVGSGAVWGGPRGDEFIDGVGMSGPIIMPSRRRREETRLIPVELDLHGQTAFGNKFVGRHGHPQLIQLFYTNRGTFSLVRPFFSENRRTDY
jgi:hypothetical protein